MKKIFVGNLPWQATEDQLRAHFEVIGEVDSAKIVVDKDTGKSRGFGFVVMKNTEDAKAAIEKLNEQPLLNRNLRVSIAEEKANGSTGGGGFKGERRDFRSGGGMRRGPGGGGRRPYPSGS
jgi:RNA recognition motif-containing protein